MPLYAACGGSGIAHLLLRISAGSAFAFLDDAGPATMRHSHIAAGPASTRKPHPARSRAR